MSKYLFPTIFLLLACSPAEEVPVFRSDSGIETAVDDPLNDECIDMVLDELISAGLDGDLSSSTAVDCDLDTRALPHIECGTKKSFSAQVASLIKEGVPDDMYGCCLYVGDIIRACKNQKI